MLGSGTGFAAMIRVFSEELFGPECGTSLTSVAAGIQPAPPTS